MAGRLLRWLLPMLAILGAGRAAHAQVPERIVAVGDLHGDLEAWQAIARAAGLINARGRWSGGRTVLVQTGDIVDRGAGSRQILDQLMRLQREAPRAGGRVVVLTGNHEAMNVIGDLRYVSPGEYAAFVTRDSGRLRDLLYEQQRATFAQRIGAAARRLSDSVIRQQWDRQTPLGLVEHQLAFSPINGVYGRWIAANPVVAKIGDTLFVHGGLSAEYGRLPLDELNRRAAAELRARTSDGTALINDPLGPLWYRGLVTRAPDPDEPPLPAGAAKVPPRPDIDTELTQVLAAAGARRMVIGHTPSLKGIVIDRGGRLVRIDTGISRYYGGVLSYLEIFGDRLVPHVVPRPANVARSPR